MKSIIITASLLSTIAFAAPTVRIHSRAANLQTFTGALGGVAATPVENSGDAKRPFSVKGDTFVNAGAAFQRSCDQQFNGCANLANGGDKSISVADCNTQKDQCTQASQGAAANANAAGANAAAGNAAANNATAAASGNNAGNINKDKNKDNKNKDDKNKDKKNGKACAAKKASDNKDSAKKGSANQAASANNTASAAGNNAAASNAGGALDLGSCKDPSIVFSQKPADGRNAPAFENKDLTDFPHGSALNIKVIAEFTCDQLTNKCKASQDTVAKCDQAASSVGGLSGQAAADAFNKALGV